MTTSSSPSLLLTCSVASVILASTAIERPTPSIVRRIHGLCRQVFCLLYLLKIKKYMDTGSCHPIPLSHLAITLFVVGGLELIESHVNKNRGPLPLLRALPHVKRSLQHLIIVLNTFTILYIFKNAPSHLQKERTVLLAGLMTFWGIKGWKFLA